MIRLPIADCCKQANALIEPNLALIYWTSGFVVVRLLAPSTVTNNRILFTNRASA